ncbi:MAG: hypothetical protein FJ128_09540 [Deltaproteobacteria bacterium]|nr:hypothetical protein [Deltaproteobacteria bacterium]
MSTSEAPDQPTATVRTFDLPVFPRPQGSPAVEKFILKPLAAGSQEVPEFVAQDLSGRMQQLLASARKRAQEIERQAYEEGFRQGQRHGQELGEKSLEPVIQRFLHLIASLETAREELHRAREQDLLRLILLIGEKMLGRELSLRPEGLEWLIRQGLQQLADSEQLRLVVHPQDYHMLQRADRSSWPPGVELAADPTLSPGGFVLETLHGDLDGAWETRWSRLARVLEEALDDAFENQPKP